MKQLVFIVACALLACEQTQQSAHGTKSQEDGNTSVEPQEEVSQLDKITYQRHTTMAQTEADFDGDGQKEMALGRETKAQEGNPVDDGTPAEYIIEFSNAKIPAFNPGCCELRLLNEGDLNGDGREELSVFQAPMNGNTYALTTYSLLNNEWKAIIGPMLIPMIDHVLTEEELQKRIFLENGKVFVLEIDLNDEDFKLVRKEAILK